MLRLGTMMEAYNYSPYGIQGEKIKKLYVDTNLKITAIRSHSSAKEAYSMCSSHILIGYIPKGAEYLIVGRTLYFSKQWMPESAKSSKRW
jgi:hypothetical protein